MSILLAMAASCASNSRGQAPHTPNRRNRFAAPSRGISSSPDGAGTGAMDTVLTGVALGALLAFALLRHSHRQADRAAARRLEAELFARRLKSASPGSGARG